MLVTYGRSPAISPNANAMGFKKLNVPMRALTSTDESSGAVMTDDLGGVSSQMLQALTTAPSHLTLSRRAHDAAHSR